jgi:thiol-disulfide isomerase/thioredoxin
VFLKCFQDWCPGCHSSGFPTLQKFAEAFGDHPKVAIAGIQTVFEGFHHNTLDDVRKLQLQYRLKIPMGHDPGDKSSGARPQTMSKYRTGGTPWLILIAPDGRVLFNDFHARTDKLIEYVASQLA